MTPETRLFQSVLLQALLDAKSVPISTTDVVEKAQAMAWFEAITGTTAENFEFVCLAANYHPDKVREWYHSFNEVLDKKTIRLLKERFENECASLET